MSRRCYGEEREQAVTCWSGHGNKGLGTGAGREGRKSADPTPPAAGGEKSKFCWAQDLNVLVGHPDGDPTASGELPGPWRAVGQGGQQGQLELRVGLGAALAWGAVCPTLASWMSLC